ncbi:MAG: hypothetical protein V4689_10210 [Verrucomicrobiota bacterium]
MSLKVGAPLAAIAIFGISRILSGFELWKHVAGVVVAISVMPLTMTLSAAVFSMLKNRWELSERGIRIGGEKRGRIRWNRIENFDFQEIDDLPGYTRVILRGKSRFVFLSPPYADLVVKLTEDELRGILLVSGTLAK